MTVRPLRVALLGAGNVGLEVARLLTESADDLAARIGAPLEVVAVLVRDTGRTRPGIDPALLTNDANAVVARKDLDIVIELLGGIEPARTLLMTAMANGASVVTANKALLATDGTTLFEAAERAGVDIYYEASVAGAIPLLRPIRESLAGDHITRVLGIVNGTTNFILTKMDESGADYGDVLREAQDLGYAEADPTADVEGHDAAAKAAILASLAFHTRVTLDDVSCEGISKVTSEDIKAAHAMGFVIKLLAIAERLPEDEGIVVRVHPAMVPREHPLASVRLAFNAVFVEAEAAGQVMFYGRGAGGAPTASSVLGDLVTVARNRVAGHHGPVHNAYADLTVRGIEAAHTRYAISLRVSDEPGVLATIANAFADEGVSLQVVRQDGSGEDAHLLVRTHKSTEAALAATITRLRTLAAVKEVVGVMRVEGEAGN